MDFNTQVLVVFRFPQGYTEDGHSLDTSQYHTAWMPTAVNSLPGSRSRAQLVCVCCKRGEGLAVERALTQL